MEHPTFAILAWLVLSNAAASNELLLWARWAAGLDLDEPDLRAALCSLGSPRPEDAPEVARRRAECLALREELAAPALAGPLRRGWLDRAVAVWRAVAAGAASEPLDDLGLLERVQREAAELEALLVTTTRLETTIKRRAA